MNRSLDTCLILSLILGVPENQYDAVYNLLSTEGQIYHIYDIAISEAVHVLETRYHYSREKIVSSMNTILAEFDDNLEYNSTLFWLVFPYYEHHKTMSFNDCMMVFYAQIGQTEPLLTFDKALARSHPSAKLLATS